MPTWTLIENLRGPAGPQGPTGPAGPSGQVSHHQTTPAATWTITHALGNRPEVVLIADDAPTVRTYTDVSYPDASTVVVEWPNPTSGWAYLG